MGEITYRTYEPGDEEGILETFNLVFREVCGATFVDRSLAHWRWQFLQNPQGLRIMLGLHEDGRVVCQYAGIPLRIRVPGDPREELSFFHAVDSMVHPEFRTGLRKRGPFLEVAGRFFETFGGKVDHLGFGYPVKPAWRIGERFLGYRLVRMLDFLLREVGMELPPSPVEVGEVRRFGGEVEELYEDLRDLFPCMTVKDSLHLNWRYADCPSVSYRLLLAEGSRGVRGLAVLRTEGGLVPGAATLGDLLLDPSDREALCALLREADRLAAEAGCETLLTVQNPALRLMDGLRSFGFRCESSARWLERKLGARDWTSGLSPEWLAGNWQYTLGDSDLF